MKIVFSWSSISGYMVACWQELAKQEGIELFVLAHESGRNTAFSSELMAGIPHRLLKPEEQSDADLIESVIVEQKPDIIAMTGWWLKPHRLLVKSTALSHVKFIMGVDSPWRHQGQYLNRIRYTSYFKRLDHVFVTGERSWQYMVRMGIPPSRLSRGMYGVDVARWSMVAKERESREWPRNFLFLGRYAHVKAIDILIAAYQEYCAAVEQPWTLTCCGKGPDEKLLKGIPGVENRGFVQPRDLDSIFLSSGCLIMPSRFDPWPLALVEAAAAGLPIICSDACGSAVENVRDAFNGYVFPTGNIGSLVENMISIHEKEEELLRWGQRSNEFATAYSAEVWKDRWLDVFKRLMLH